MVPANTRTLLLGENEKRSIQWGIGAGILLVVSLLYFAAVKAVGSPTVHLALWWEGYAVFLTGLVAVQAYSNGGVVVSLLLTFAGVVGLVLNYGGIGVTGDGPGLLQLIVLAAVGGVAAAAIVGTVGFGIGTAVRRIAG
jgi:hypothetical protein